MATAMPVAIITNSRKPQIIWKYPTDLILKAVLAEIEVQNEPVTQWDWSKLEMPLLCDLANSRRREQSGVVEEVQKGFRSQYLGSSIMRIPKRDEKGISITTDFGRWPLPYH